MPTVIDELVVSLRLDPKGFTEGQRDAITALRGFEGRVQRTTQVVGEGAANLRGLFDSITHPVAALKSALQDVAQGSKKTHEENVTALKGLDSQARRTGDAVRAGGMAGAEGFRNLAIAGLAAFAALESVKKVMDDVTKTDAKLGALGRAAFATNLAPQQLGALENVLFERAQVPKETTASTLFSFEQTRQGYLQSGEYPAQFQAAARFFGMSADEAARTPLPQLLAKVAATLQQAAAHGGGAAAQYQAGQLGLGPLAVGLTKEGTGFAADLADAAMRAPTASQVQHATEFQQALAKLEDTFDQVHVTLVDRVNPGITKFIESLNNLAVDTDKVADAVVSMVAAIMGALIPGGGFLAHEALDKPAPAGSDTGVTGWWRRNAPNWLPGFMKPSPAPVAAPTGGGAAAPIASPTGALPTDRWNRSVAFFEGKGLSHDQSVGVTSRLYAESRLDPTAVNATSGAYGLAQWLGGRKPAALATGGDFDRQLDLVWNEFQTTEAAAFARVKASGPAADAARAMEGYERAGNPAFTEGAAALATRMATTDTSRLGTNLPSAPQVAANDDSAGHDKDWVIERYKQMAMAAHTKKGQIAAGRWADEQLYADWTPTAPLVTAAVAAPPVTNNSATTSNTRQTVGNVNVHVASGNPFKIGGAVQRAVRDALTTDAQTGIRS